MRPICPLPSSVPFSSTISSCGPTDLRACQAAAVTRPCSVPPWHTGAQLQAPTARGLQVPVPGRSQELFKAGCGFFFAALCMLSRQGRILRFWAARLTCPTCPHGPAGSSGVATKSACTPSCHTKAAPSLPYPQQCISGLGCARCATLRKSCSAYARTHSPEGQDSRITRAVVEAVVRSPEG